MEASNSMILVVDFGSQTAHLIARRVKELGFSTKFITPEVALAEIKKHKPQGIILSGGPMSVYEKNAPSIDPKVYDLKIPILGICYGFQLIAHQIGGKVISGRKEYGPAKLKIENLKLKITDGLAKTSVVWMNHGDEIVSLPKDFVVVGETENVPFTFSVSEKRKIYGILFHPEVEHTEYGMQILANFLEICRSSYRHPERSEGSHSRNRDSSPSVQNDIIVMIDRIKQTVGSSYVIGAVSGGVDSTVAGTLLAKAVGKQFIPVYVDNGLMRKDAKHSVQKAFIKFGIKPIIVDVQKEMLRRLKGIVDPEQKRKVIGKFYIEIFEMELKKLTSVIARSETTKQSQKRDRHASLAMTSGSKIQFLMQGTIYSDVIESQGTKHASKIKSHHNVGGLPEKMKLKLIEPLREFYKDEVRTLGRKLGLSEGFVMHQPFPGPGYAVRIRGEVTKERLEKAKQADEIVLEELEKAHILSHVFLSFPILTGADSTAIKGDAKFFGEVIALRIVESKDIMTATWARLPYDILQKISSRVVNEVEHISRVVYDISTKPPATMEWE